jgi:hypothetical protein
LEELEIGEGEAHPDEKPEGDLNAVGADRDLAAPMLSE